MPEMLGGGPLAPVMVPVHRIEQAICMMTKFGCIDGQWLFCNCTQVELSIDCDDYRSPLYKFIGVFSA